MMKEPPDLDWMTTEEIRDPGNPLAIAIFAVTALCFIAALVLLLT